MQNLPIFVYGTLQRGQCREGCWPCAPRAVVLATTRGKLYDLGAYPALVESSGLVAGELWYLADEDIALTLRELDEIEGYRDCRDDLYVRRIVDCTTPPGQATAAYAYFYAHPERLTADQWIAPDASGPARWPAITS